MVASKGRLVPPEAKNNATAATDPITVLIPFSHRFHESRSSASNGGAQTARQWAEPAKYALSVSAILDCPSRHDCPITRATCPLPRAHRVSELKPRQIAVGRGGLRRISVAFLISPLQTRERKRPTCRAGCGLFMESRPRRRRPARKNSQGSSYFF